MVDQINSIRKYKQLFIADILDDPEEEIQVVAHFFGIVRLKATNWRNRVISMNTIYTIDKLALEVVVAREEGNKRDQNRIPLDELLKGQAHLETRIQMIDADLIDPQVLLQCPKPHRKYGGLLKSP